jgi:hypothetical protein
MATVFRILLAGLALVAAPLSAQDTVPDYVGSAACAECHTDAMEAWQGSHHAKAWTPPTADHILGDFNDSTFTHKGITSRFYREGDTFMIETDGPDGRMTRYPVHSVAGIEPLQQYLLETEEGRLQSFDVVWDTEKNEWYHLYPDQTLYGGDGLHWTGPYKNWNARCAECHATGFEKNYTPITRSYASTQSEIGVGCEACHGPGEAHLQWAGAQETSQTPWVGLTETGLTIDMSAGGEAYLQQCATCHARREAFEQGNPLPGKGFHDAYRLSTLRDGMYHADGQILEEVYVYGSFLQSKMYAQGVTCNDCHTPHSAELRAEGNGICTQCHAPAGNPAFPTLKGALYDDPSHHFHEPGTAGAQCKSCHMIERNYMVVDGRRDHSFRIPRPDLSIETRSPNACTDCHAEETAQWAAAAVEGWYPESENRGSHYGQTIAAGRENAAAHAEDLAALAEYEALPAIVRATALEMLAPVATAEHAARLAPLLSDAEPLVRAHAVTLQRAAPDDLRAERLFPALDDPVKAVRIAAAREFLNTQVRSMPEAASQHLSRAMGDWQQSLVVKSDFPEVQLVFGGIGLTTRRMDVALRAFGEATVLDPQLVQAWVMVIRIHDALGDREAALDAANRALQANPDDVQLNLLRSELL